jgi:hypothetical protein
MNPQDRRFAAIADTVSKFLGDDHAIRSDVTRQQVFDAIRPLGSLGRTGRWINTIGTWECMILDAGNDLNWALLQGSTFAVHAA